jgi:hypothetical protein
MNDAVLLEDVRCDGAGHDGCKRTCQIWWKEVWLRPAPGGVTGTSERIPFDELQDLPSLQPGKKYVCQSTELLKGTTHLSAFDLKQYIRDIRNRNFTVFQILYYLYNFVMNRIYYKLGKQEFGKLLGRQTKTPVEALNLQVGEFVDVKTREGIVATLDNLGNNRGLSIDKEMLWYEGRRFRVLRRVDRIILEKSAEMREIKNTVLLENVSCTGLCKRGCTRGGFPMWREAWLKRAG